MIPVLWSYPRHRGWPSLCDKKQQRRRGYCGGQQYSITALTDSAGTIKERYAYRAYGTPTITDAAGTIRTASAENDRYLYTGREYDEDLALYHYRARMYDPVSGRFCSRDPIGYEDGSSLYRQGFGITELDPHGTCARRTPEECCKEAFANPDIAIPPGGDEPSAGMVICCDGRKVACAKAKGTIKEKDGVDIFAECIKEQEKDHFDDVPDCDPNDPIIRRPRSPEDVNLNLEECKAHLVQFECILDRVGRCKGNAACLQYLKRKLNNMAIEMNTRNCSSNYGIEYPKNWRDWF